MFKSFAALALRRFRSSDAVNCHGQQLSQITKIWFTPLPKDSQWIAPCQMHYVENGQKKNRDIVKLYDGVLVVVYNISKKKLIYVRQFRPAVYHGILGGNTLEIPKEEVDLMRFPPELGVTLEPCAGVVDKTKSLADIASEEVREECGYNVPADKMERIFEFRSGVGASSAALTLFYCEVCDSQKVSDGGGIGDEAIQVVELSIDEAKSLVQKGATLNSGPGTLIGTLWFLCNQI
ncbi:uridine diphosphate glucose pyrophosphatase NUDT14-like [Drosophila montana]|uniref:uridine diphosphate glucose pyrophosphatase NUDT14-like n=1 Tax=Drosophila montana TaxID=40370 RepID=UPI00313D9267